MRRYQSVISAAVESNPSPAAYQLPGGVRSTVNAKSSPYSTRPRTVAFSTAARWYRSRIAKGSLASSRWSATAMRTSTTVNGSAVMVMRFCRPVSAVSPPVSSITTAMPAMHSAQNTVIVRRGAGAPRCESCEFTIEAESAVVMKKTASMTITTGATSPPPGSWSRTTQKISAGAGSEAAVPSGATEPRVRCSQMVVPPMIVNAPTITAAGMNRAPRTYWRMVRPFEIFAMNTPTNGAQLTHHAQ